MKGNLGAEVEGVTGNDTSLSVSFCSDFHVMLCISKYTHTHTYIKKINQPGWDGGDNLQKLKTTANEPNHTTTLLH